MNEQEMAKALGDKFTHYIGKEEQNIARTNSALRRKAFSIPQMTEKQKAALRAKMLELEKLRQKQYVSGKYSFQRAIDICCVVYDVTEEELLSPRRMQRLVRARQAVIVLMRDKRGYSWPEIGRRLGRDHSTIIHSYLSAKANPDAKFEEFTQRIEEYQA